LKQLSYRNRRRDPIEEMQNGVVAALRRFSADFLESASFKHALSKGEEREVPIQDFFRAHLPEMFSVDKGEVVDTFGQKSPQLDLIITDRMRNVALRSGSIVIMPAEALLVSVEVKSRLTAEEIKSSLKAAAQLRDLKPFKVRLSGRRRGGAAADDRCRYFHTVFAYETDLSATGWLEAEFARIDRVSSDLKVPAGVIDRVYVANRGLINVPEATGVEESPAEGTALLQYYMHTLNFLIRENARREQTPYLEYAGRMTGGWRSFRVPSR
jgi:hypothetical protein